LLRNYKKMAELINFKALGVSVLMVGGGVAGLVGTGQTLRLLTKVSEACAAGGADASTDICTTYNTGAEPTFSSTKKWMGFFVALFSVLTGLGTLYIVFTILKVAL
jgi:hypothetical protein